MENKYYQIGDLAKILNISRQMIRYYEECGVISPIRTAGNNYRLYSAMDYFALAEAACLSRFGVNISDIYQLKMSDYTNRAVEYFEKYISESHSEIEYREMMIRRAEQLIEKTETASMNVGNKWIRKVPAHVLFPLMRSKNDIYEEICTPDGIVSRINSGENIVFGDGLIEFNENDEFWWISIDEEYFRNLKISMNGQCRRVGSQYCLCTVMDMGDIGEFDADEIRKLISEISSSGYIAEGKASGLLLSRGEENGQFHRFLEVRIPVRKP